MAHFEVPIIKITKVEDHPYADRLSLNYFREFVTISAKLEDGSPRYKEGDLAIYVPEAAIVPENLLRKGFWNEKENKGMLAGSKGNRTKAIKLRQIISQGIMFSVEMFEGFDEEKHFCFTHSFPDFPVKEGMDVSSLLGIIKYEPVIPASMSGEVTNIGIEHKINFDVENIQKFPHLIQEGEEVIITEKGHGTNCQIYFDPRIDNDEVWDKSWVISKGLGSSGLGFKNNETNNSKNIYCRIMNSLYNKETFETLFKGKRFALFGEIIGKGIQDLDYDLKEPIFLLFDVAVDGVWQSWDVVESVAENLQIDTVPIIYHGPFNTECRNLKNGKSTITEKHIREGTVIKHTVPQYSNEIGRIILKDINPEYLTRKGKVTEYA